VVGTLLLSAICRARTRWPGARHVGDPLGCRCL